MESTRDGEDRAHGLGLYEGFGIEIEYMIVDAETLAVRPLADELLRRAAGAYVMEIEQGPLAWSNELALHVIELKTNGPAETLTTLPALFQADVGRIDDLLRPLGSRLMPTAMHPFMDPSRELQLWPHGDRRIYDALHRVFDCTGHGWANLQSVHINLPFAGDEQFGRLHAAIRLVLPLLPALAASSPLCDGRVTGTLDTRVDVYRSNARRVPAVTGATIPEPIFSRRAYEETLLQRIYADLAVHDPEGILQHEWVNARGCIARFSRDTIEIRLIDVQECPAADLAISAAVVALVKALTDERLSSYAAQQRLSEQALAAILADTIARADRAVIDHPAFLDALGMRAQRCLASEVWEHAVETTLGQEPSYPVWRPTIELILRRGCLARRILSALGGRADHGAIAEVYTELCRCLSRGALFT